MDDNYDLSYFAARNQDKDRPALWFYERVICRWIKSGNILDYGCGTGFLLKRLARHYSVAGYDVSNHALKAACVNVPDLTFFFRDDDFPKSFFTGIVSLHVLEHIDRLLLPSVLASWYEALIPRGRVLCVVPDASGRGLALAGQYWTSYGDPTHVTLMGHNDWRELFIASGFSVCAMGTDGLWCLPYRQGKSKFRDALRFSIPTLFQFLLGRLVLRVGSGESAIFLLEKN